MAEEPEQNGPGKFTLLPDFDPQNLHDKDERVCVVSVIGKSKLNFHHSKATMINQLLLSDAFTGNIPEGAARCSVETPSLVEAFYDSKEHVIYLHLQSECDTCQLVQLCQKAAQHISSVGADSFWQSAEFYHARMLLFVFSLSHIVLLVHPGNAFDTSYVRLFRVLDGVRQKLQHSITDQLRSLQVSKEWCLAGRLCSPRVLFIFESCLLKASGDGSVRGKNQNRPRKKLQHAIEDQIYRILRKSRIITNISNNSLFAVPANQEFVFVYQKSVEACDPTKSFLNHLLRICSFDPGGTSLSEAGDTASHVGSSEKNSSSSTLREFLWQHVEVAHSKGFDDNVGRNPPPAIFEMPTAETWFDVACSLLSYFTADYLETRARPHFNSLQSHLDLNMRFSESRCQKVLPVAESAYQDGLPQHYTYSYHHTKVAQAKRVYQQHARGPATEKYLKQLELNCDNMWKGGRQLCEAVSLTGNHCVNELHRVDLCEDVSEEDKDLPVMPHASPFTTKAYCNCGSKQAEREDPFDAKSANFDFYDKLEEVCCGNLEHHKFPVWRNANDVKKATYSKAVLQNGDNDVLEDPSIVAISSRDVNKKKMIEDATDLSSGMLKLSLKKNSDNNNVMRAVEGNTKKHAEVSIIDSDLGADKAKFLKGMLNDKTSDGLLPKFASWSLVCLGKYGCYAPSLGVEQSGFLHSTNFMLPWDVYLQNLDKEKWPSVVDSGFRRGKFRKGQREDSVALRLYLGMEYECPRGHRFFCSGPDKIFKAPSSGIFKESAHRIVTNDMPLYFPCHCRSSKGFMAQLMRVFVAVPEGPVEVHLRPMVQPAPAPCPAFHPGKDALVVPPGDMWVLRLPYIYTDEKTAYMMPRDPQHLANCRILKGLFTFVNTALTNR